MVRSSDRRHLPYNEATLMEVMRLAHIGKWSAILLKIELLCVCPPL